MWRWSRSAPLLLSMPSIAHAHRSVVLARYWAASVPRTTFSPASAAKATAPACATCSRGRLTPVERSRHSRRGRRLRSSTSIFRPSRLRHPSDPCSACLRRSPRRRSPCHLRPYPRPPRRSPPAHRRSGRLPQCCPVSAPPLRRRRPQSPLFAHSRGRLGISLLIISPMAYC